MHSFSLLQSHETRKWFISISCCQGKCIHSVFCRVTECSEALRNVAECFLVVVESILIMTLKPELEWSIHWVWVHWVITWPQSDRE